MLSLDVDDLPLIAYLADEINHLSLPLCWSKSNCVGVVRSLLSTILSQFTDWSAVRIAALVLLRWPWCRVTAVVAIVCLFCFRPLPFVQLFNSLPKLTATRLESRVNHFKCYCCSSHATSSSAKSGVAKAAVLHCEVPVNPKSVVVPPSHKPTAFFSCVILVG